MIDYNALKTACKQFKSWKSIGYKKCNFYMVILQILGETNEDRKGVINPKYAKFRTSEAVVLKIISLLDLSEDTVSVCNTMYQGKQITYTVGQTVKEPDYDTNHDKVNSTGVHYFRTVTAAYFFDNNHVDNGVFYKFTDQGSILRTVFKKNGYAHGTTCIYFEDSKEIHIKCDYKNGKLDGAYTSYYRSGSIYEYCAYVKGMKQGIYMRYYDNVKLAVRANFLDDQYHGRYESFDLSGKPMEECFFLNGKQHGAFFSFDKSGHWKMRCEFVKGSMTGDVEYNISNKPNKSCMYKAGTCITCNKKYNSVGDKVCQNMRDYGPMTIMYYLVPNTDVCTITPRII